MHYLQRAIKVKLDHILKRGKSLLLLGPRQTGKTTLMREIKATRVIDFANPTIRLRYEKDPGLLIQEIESLEPGAKPLIVIDEVQKVPAILDATQYLIDNKLAQFILTGSSARKLKRDGEVNLLPGRVIALQLDALMISEIPSAKRQIENLIVDGSLPEIVLTDDDADREQLLESYVITYLEEEIRMEALVRNLGSFSRFLELAAAESGYLANLHKISQMIGVAASTIESYYQILEDCLVVERIEPITESKTRHRLVKAQKYLFYDLGVRRVAAREGRRLPSKYLGHLFEQFVGIELIKLSRLQTERTRIRYWSDANGPEVDWVVESPQHWTPIEVKWTDTPSIKDARHLKIFLEEYPKAKHGYIICRTPHRMKIADNITAISWEELATLF